MTTHPSLAHIPALLDRKADSFAVDIVRFTAKARREAEAADYHAAAGATEIAATAAVARDECARLAALVNTGADPIAVLADMIAATNEMTSGTTTSDTGAMLGVHAHNRPVIIELTALYSVVSEHITSGPGRNVTVNLSDALVGKILAQQDTPDDGGDMTEMIREILFIDADGSAA